MASKKLSTEVIETFTKKQYVTGGPHLWVSTLLHEKGNMSTNRIWEEYLRDQTIAKSMIPTKSFLKNRILQAMEAQGKIARDRAMDLPQFKRAGWKLNAARAFKNTEPSIVMKLDPIPQLDRKDVREYIQKQYNLFEEVLQEEDQTVEDAMKQAENKNI